MDKKTIVLIFYSSQTYIGTRNLQYIPIKQLQTLRTYLVKLIIMQNKNNKKVLVRCK